ncbi:MAG TPA: hypothetical protein DC042_03895 [Bacteroidales bacterium]|nr:hypothetical protein [Bacteroidales bacterium]
MRFVRNGPGPKTPDLKPLKETVPFFNIAKPLTRGNRYVDWSVHYQCKFIILRLRNIYFFIMRKLAVFLFLLLPAFFSLNSSAQVNQSQLGERDTLKMSRDSILRLVRIKDSLLILSRRDSMAMSHLIQNLEYNRDSLFGILNEIRYKRIEDSLNHLNQYYKSRDFNRRSKTTLKEFLPGIDEDSVKASLSDVVGLVYDDTAFSPKPRLLKSSMDRLLEHLNNDSTWFSVINSKDMAVPFAMKNNRTDSAAFFVMNSNNDSAKVYMKSIDKHTVYMWVGDDLKLQHLLKKQGTPDGIPIQWVGPQKYRVARRPVPTQAPKLWTKRAEFLFMINQASFSNWSKGGNSSIALSTDVKASANYAKGNIKWDNFFWFVYGVQKAELLDLRKNQDKIELRSGLSHVAFKNFNYSIGGSFITQSFKGYSYPNDSVPVSKFMAPATLQLNVGMEYRPNPGLKINMSPVSAKFTAVLDTVLIDQTKFGLKEGQRIRPELGAQVLVEHKTVLFKNVNMSNRLILFTNYLYHPEKVDIDWLLTLDLKVNKYITTTIRTNLIYDDDIILPLYEVKDGKKVKIGEGKRVQFMEILAIGFKYILY